MVNFFKRKKLAEPTTKPIKVLHVDSLGSYGSLNYSGYPSEEYLHNLQGTQRATIYDKMRRSDPQIIMCLGAVKAPILAASWQINAYDNEDEESKQDAELINKIIFGNRDFSFSCFLEEALTSLDFGFSVFELIDKVNMYDAEFGSYIGIKEIAYRSQKTIERWNLDRGTGKLLSVSQYAYGDLDRFLDIPSEFLIVFSNKKEGANYEGVSMLRGCYGPWFRKNTYLKLNAIGIEKFAIPTPIAEIPEGKESSEQFDNLILALEKYQAHEAGYITHPAGWKINLNTNTYDPQKVEVSIDNEDKRIAKSFIANFLELGMNGFGSQSLSIDLSDFFLKSIQFVANRICEEFNTKIIPRYVDLNRPGRTEYPYMTVSGISDDAGLELSQVVSNLIGSKVIIPDDELEKYMRKRYNLPEVSDSGKRESSVPQFSERLKWLKG